MLPFSKLGVMIVALLSSTLVSALTLAENNGAHGQMALSSSATRQDLTSPCIGPDCGVQATKLIEWHCWDNTQCDDADDSQSTSGVSVGAGQKRCVQLPDNCMSSFFLGSLGGCSVKGFVNVGKTCDTGGQPGTIGAGCHRTGFIKAWEISCP
ncbi:hypothetical protein FS749_012458 [Ceratobasidium sp. UAMH 11750]|nr:hypothetical protein FS749_012458 [Ceratobasidium sp. UAMH 11750]